MRHTLSKSLAEVSKGKYDDFRAWLIQSDCTDLNLTSGEVINVDLSQLGKALQGTAVTKIDMQHNNISDAGAKEFAQALKGTAVSYINFSNNKISPEGAKELAQALKGTVVTFVSLGNMGPGVAKEFLKALKGTPVRQVKLWSNNIDNADAIELLESLAGSQVERLYLGYNSITIDIAPELVPLIENTHLLGLELPFSHTTIIDAIKKNHKKNLEKIQITPYEAARLQYLPDNIKVTLLEQQLTSESTNQEQIKYAGGILANVPLEMAQFIVSFLPLMNATKIKNIFDKAKEKTPSLLENKEEAKISKSPYVF